MNDDGVRQRAAEDLESAERQIELLRAQIVEQEQHAEDVRRFLALFQAYQPGGATPAVGSRHIEDPAENLIVAAFGGRDR